MLFNVDFSVKNSIQANLEKENKLVESSTLKNMKLVFVSFKVKHNQRHNR